MATALSALNLKFCQEPFKMLPCDPLSHFDNMGRIKVELFDAYGNPLNKKVDNKLELLKLLGAMIPEIPERINRIEAFNAENKLMIEEEAREERVRIAEEKKKVPGSGNSTGNNKKKKGKK